MLFLTIKDRCTKLNDKICNLICVEILISIIKMKMNDSVQCTVKIQSEIAVMAKRRNVISYAINQLIIH